MGTAKIDYDNLSRVQTVFETLFNRSGRNSIVCSLMLERVYCI